MPEISRRFRFVTRWGAAATPRSRLRWIGWLALGCVLAFFAQVVFASGNTMSRESPSASPGSAASPYQAGPIDRVRPAAPDLPSGSEELLGIGVLAAILYGLRMVELGRAPRSH